MLPIWGPPHKRIIFLLKRAKKFNSYVLIDEAYYGFYNYSAINLIRRFSNLIVLRTFSKAYGLAGCRVGFIIANKTLAKRLYKSVHSSHLTRPPKA